jgi:hypothetical protein
VVLLIVYVFISGRYHIYHLHLVFQEPYMLRSLAELVLLPIGNIIMSEMVNQLIPINLPIFTEFFCRGGLSRIWESHVG